MAQLAHAAGKTTADLPQTFGLSNLAKKHGHKLVPAFKSFRISFCFMFQYQIIKFISVKKRY
jgi:hypothetical protein